MLKAKLLAGGGTAATLYAEDVFSAYTYTGNGSTQTITNGIDLAGKGGMVWLKDRAGGANHRLYDTSRLATNSLVTNNTAATTTYATSLTAFNSTGFTLGADAVGDWNYSAHNYVSWTFRNADKFYNHTTVVKTGGSNATVSFANLTTLGMVRVKRTDSTGSWYIWHRSLTAGKLLIGETTAAEATLGHITVSGTTVTLVNGVIADGTYLVEGFAHDTGTDGLIQCGSFTTDGSGNATVTLGWEPQYVMIKCTNAAQTWYVFDEARGFTVAGSSDEYLQPNSSVAAASASWISKNATGFVASDNAWGASQTFIYLAIRRPNKPPTTGTQVYNAIARTGTGAAATVTGVGFAPDLVMSHQRDATLAAGTGLYDRLRGAGNLLIGHLTNAESADATTLTSFNMDGASYGTDGTGRLNNSGTTYGQWFFKRAPGVMDVVCYTGTGSAHTVSHGLGAVPELMIVKKRSAADAWYVYVGSLGATKELILNMTLGTQLDGAALWNSTAPTSSVFSLGTDATVNQSTGTFVAYLFATLPGISKCGSYTGNGSSQTIACGFTTGARFILIKRTDSTGDWYVWDTVRGIVAGNDPHLSLNTTTAEVTTDDSIDPDTSGFIVNELAATHINVTSATYIFLALA